MKNDNILTKIILIILAMVLFPVFLTIGLALHEK